MPLWLPKGSKSANPSPVELHGKSWLRFGSTQMKRHRQVCPTTETNLAADDLDYADWGSIISLIRVINGQVGPTDSDGFANTETGPMRAQFIKVPAHSCECIIQAAHFLTWGDTADMSRAVPHRQSLFPSLRHCGSNEPFVPADVGRSLRLK